MSSKDNGIARVSVNGRVELGRQRVGNNFPGLPESPVCRASAADITDAVQTKVQIRNPVVYRAASSERDHK